MGAQEWCFRTNTRMFANFGHAVASRKFVAPLLILIGALVIGGCVPGLFFFYSEENEITKLCELVIRLVLFKGTTPTCSIQRALCVQIVMTTSIRFFLCISTCVPIPKHARIKTTKCFLRSLVAALLF